jgi:hypothetical protein
MCYNLWGFIAVFLLLCRAPGVLWTLPLVTASLARSTARKEMRCEQQLLNPAALSTCALIAVLHTGAVYKCD